MRVDLESQQQQQQQQQQQMQTQSHPSNYPSISLVLPKNAPSATTESIDHQKVLLNLNNADDPSATLSQQEELSVKGRQTYFTGAASCPIDS
jgi:hypothetical protein